MKEHIYVMQDEVIKLRLTNYHPCLAVINAARLARIKGKFEIHWVLIENEENYTYTVTYVNQENHITAELYPLRHLMG
jgi:hypothetical protein